MAKRRGNKYDRIFKENFGDPTAWLIKNTLKARSIKPVALPSKLQRTLEREMDGFWLVEQDGSFLVDVEWQTSNDPVMAGRMLLYYGLGYISFELPVLGYVIYVGDKPLNMTKELVHPTLTYRYEIISLLDMDPEEFLNSDVPEDVLLAILAGHTRGEEKKEIVQKILVKLHLLLKDNLSELGRRLEQLEVLGELRGIQKLIIKEEQNMRFVDAVMEAYNIENDIRFQQGEEKRELEKNIAFVTNLIEQTNFSNDKIASLAEVSVAFVSSIRKRLKAN